MKARAQFQQRGYVAVYPNPSFIRLGETGHQPEQRALARAVAADHCQALACLDGERDVLESVKGFRALAVDDWVR